MADNDLLLQMEDGDEFGLVMDDSDPLNMELGNEILVVNENNYERLVNKPLINSVVLIGNRTTQQLGLQAELPVITRQEIRDIINEI